MHNKCMDIRKIIGHNVRRLREKYSMSQDDLAYRSGLHRTYISGIERGIRNPTASTLEILATALSATVADLISEHSE